MCVVGGIMTQAALHDPEPIAAPTVQKRVHFVLPIASNPRLRTIKVEPTRPKPPRPETPIRRCFGPRIFI